MSDQTPQPAPPAKKQNKGLLGCGIVFAVIIVIAISVAMTPPDSKQASTSSASSAEPATAPVAQPAKPTPTQWVKIASYTGSGTKKTPKFTVGDEWKLTWEAKAGQYGDGNFIVCIYEEGSEMPDIVANVIGANKDESYQYTAGTFYLDINAGEPYAIAIWEKT